MRLYVLLAFLVVYIGAGAYFLFGYELGLRKPKFEAGQCVSLNWDDEFKSHRITKIILEVGKRDYHTFYVFDDGTIDTRGDSESFRQLDRSYVAVSCAGLIKGLK